MSNSTLESLRHPPEAVVKFINRLISEYRDYEGPERRTEARNSAAVPVTVQFLDDEYWPLNKPFATISHNLSGGGIGLICDKPIPCHLILVHLTLKSGETMNLIASVRHCTQKADHYQIGARFIVKWNDARHEF